MVWIMWCVLHKILGNYISVMTKLWFHKYYINYQRFILGEMAHQIKRLPPNLISIPSNYMVEGEKWLLQVVLWPMHASMHTYIHTRIHKCKKWKRTFQGKMKTLSKGSISLNTNKYTVTPRQTQLLQEPKCSLRLL